MKIIVQILFLILAISCGESQIRGKEETANSKLQIPKEELSVFIIPDTSYSSFWCSIEILKKTSESIEYLDISGVAAFLATFHKDCNINVEYSEWSNELLFKVVQRYPEYVLQLLYKNSSLNKEIIKLELSSPINDSFEKEMIVEIFKKANAPELIKAEMIESLNHAKERSK